MVGCPADPDIPVAPGDLEMDHDRFENHVWPILAHRIPQFDALRVINSWAGHYAHNRLDQNPIVGRHTEIENFIFLNGFSERRLQQSPAMGTRGERAYHPWRVSKPRHLAFRLWSHRREQADTRIRRHLTKTHNQGARYNGNVSACLIRV